MAKLLAARVAWSNADAALQIHGGNGYALEFEISRVLCDARILNIFEGAAEIQAQVIGRGLSAHGLRFTRRSTCSRGRAKRRLWSASSPGRGQVQICWKSAGIPRALSLAEGSGDDLQPPALLDEQALE